MTGNLSPNSTSELITLLDRQKAVYHQLRSLSQRQADEVAAADPESLLNTLSQRQVLIDQLVEISASVEPYKQAWPQFLSQLDEEVRVEIRARIEAVQALLDEIIKQDEQDRLALVGHRARMAGEMQKVRQGSALHKAYGRPVPSSPRLTDKQG